ncbi:MAG: hypothetical protein Q8M51_09485 [Polaromonas sp.]|uniref:hypothetical protein n=1 Tax=Polaromonas sp. TaxID=1869339 RepID=UPI002731D4E3|nr:hypothetical protein [Polaromonas sp.]MDP1742607.1 hypothetical protein [Polaromonas sp.]MDP1955625.1 hypothetical protein [Polaromonas sp.]MDP3356077.1 hypothetical protein [Polaromonas sp.]MDP3752483.1 hypothetical protein [Polaromonas sp.]
MTDYALPLASLGVLFLWCAWRERVADNRRDAKLLATCGAGGVLAGAAVWLV